MLRRLRRLGFIAALTYVAVCLAVYVFQGRMIYFPTAAYERTPADVGLDYDTVILTADDGVRITAWYVPADGAMGTVLFCHGNAGNLSDRLTTLRLLNLLGCNVLALDYRGYGTSEGKPDEQGTYLDAEAAWRYLVQEAGHSPERVVLLGRSLGGAVAVELATRHQPAALVVESSFTSLADVGQIHYPLLPVRPLCRFRYDSARKVPDIACPKLFIHSTDDELIPLEVGRRLYEAAAEPKQFLETPGGHNTGGFTYSPEYTRMLGAFLGEALGHDGQPEPDG